MRSTRRVPKSHVSITKNPLEGEAIKEGWENLPLSSLISPEDQVVITPNWVKNEPPEAGTIVGPGSLREVIRIVKGYKPKQIVVACGSGGAATSQVFSEQGFDQVIEEEGVGFVDLNYGPFTELKLEGCIPESTPVNELLAKTDVLISYTQIKHHEEAVVTLGTKNIALSFPPAQIHGFPKTKLGIHHNLHDFIAAMGKAIPIDLTILSGNHAMVGTGPSGGKPVQSELVVMGTDPVTTDVVGARLLGFMPQAIAYLWKLIQAGVGEGDLNKAQVSGISLKDAEKIFSEAAFGFAYQVDEGPVKGVHI